MDDLGILRGPFSEFPPWGAQSYLPGLRRPRSQGSHGAHGFLEITTGEVHQQRLTLLALQDMLKMAIQVSKNGECMNVMDGDILSSMGILGLLGRFWDVLKMVAISASKND